MLFKIPFVSQLIYRRNHSPQEVFYLLLVLYLTLWVLSGQSFLEQDCYFKISLDESLTGTSLYLKVMVPFGKGG